MMHHMETREFREYLESIIFRAIVYYEDMSISSLKNRLYDGSDTGRFIIGSYQEYDLILIYGHADVVYLLKPLFLEPVW